MADQVTITTQAGTGAVVNSSVSSSGAINSSVAAGTTAQSQVSVASSFATTTSGASGPQGEPGADGVFSAIASQAEAEAGTDNVKGMSPLRVKQAIDTLATGDVASVNGATGTVVLDQDDIGDGTTYKQYSQTEKTKLSGIATGATANSSDATLLARANHTGTQTASTISDFDTEVANNTTVDANTTKLAGIESGATADQTGAEIKTAYEAEADTNAFTDAEKTLLGNQSGTNTGDQDLSSYVTGPVSVTDNTIPRYNGTTGKAIEGTGVVIDDDGDLLSTGIIESNLVMGAPDGVFSEITEYTLDSGVTVDGVLIKDTLVDGRDVSVDGTKLDGIEVGAEVNDVTSVNGATGAVTVDETDILPIQTGNSGKFLSTNGTLSSWETLAGGGDMSASTYDPATVSEQLVGLTATQTLTNKTLTSPVINTPTGIVKGDVGLGNVDNTSDATKQTATLLAAWPVNSVYTSIVNTNPSSLFGGTWVSFGAGRVLVGFDSGQTEFDTAEETGGTKEVTLTSAQSGLPAHGHSLTSQVVARGATGTGSNDTQAAGNRSLAGAVALNNTAADAASPHTNLQPYIVVYFFKRTA